MKKIFFPLAAFAAIATACQVEDVNEAQTPAGETFTIEAVIGTDADTDTKTSLTIADNAYKVDWEAEDELSVIARYNNGAEDAGYLFTKGDGNSFSGSVTDPENIGEIYVVYPYNENHDSFNDNYGNINGFVTIGSAHDASQTQNGIDNTDHINGPLYGYAQVSGGTAEVTMKHISTLFELIVTNNSGNEINVANIKLANDQGEAMIGTFYVNPETDYISASGASYVSSTASLDVTNGTLASGATAKFYITSAPFDLNAGDELTVTVTTSDGANAVITKEIGETVQFEAGKINHVKAEINEIVAPEPIEPFESGNYVVLAKVGDEYYALASTNTNGSSTRLDAVPFEYNGIDKSVVFDDESVIWNITGNETYFTLSNAGKYIAYSGSDNTIELSDTEYPLLVTVNQDGTYAITSVSVSERILAKNTSGEYFAFYKATSNQVDDLYLIPAEYAVLPIISFDADNVSITYDDADAHTVSVTIDHATSVSVKAYDDEGGQAESSWLTVNYSNGELSYQASVNETTSARTAYIIVTATNENGSRSSSISVLQGVNTASGPITVSMNEFTAISTDNINGDTNVYYTCAKGGGTTAPAVNSGQIRIYQGSSGVGGNITISAIEGYKIQSVTIGTDMTTSIKYEIDGNGEHLPEVAESLAQGETYVLSDQNASSITFHCYGSDSKHRLYVNYLSVTYIAE